MRAVPTGLDGTISPVAGTLVSFLGVAVLVSLLPGPATALVVRSAALHGRREAFHTVLGNSTGILGWALASVLGISALVAASEAAFAALKVVGAVVLVWLGVQALRGGKAAGEGRPRRLARTAFAQGLLTSGANPKLAIFFIALLPQFVPEGAPVLPWTLAMAAILIAVDLVYFSALAWVVSRARHAIVGSRLARRVEQLTGAVMIGLGLRVALESR
jgi:threonine/homoserine/homoserine lactone efflux protein